MSIGNRGNMSIGISVSVDSSMGESGIDKGSVSLTLAVVSDNWSVDKGSSSSAQANSSLRFLLLNGKSWDKAGNLMDGSSKVSIGSSNSLIATNSNRDRVASD